MFLKISQRSIPEPGELGPIESVDTWNLYRKRLMASPFLLAWAIPIGILGPLGGDAARYLDVPSFLGYFLGCATGIAISNSVASVIIGRRISRDLGLDARKSSAGGK